MNYTSSPHFSRCENTLSKVFETNTDGPQGDRASALDFTYYLDKTLKPARSNQLAESVCITECKIKHS